MADVWRSEISMAGSDTDWKERLSKSIREHSWSDELQGIVTNIAAGVSLTMEEGFLLFEHHDIDELFKLAKLAKESRFDNQAFFNVNVHINQTNICTLACKFCAFRRGRKADDAYAMSIVAYIEDLRQYSNRVDEVHSVGGLHPDWDVDHYCEMFTRVSAEFPHIHIKALTAVEIKHIAQLSEIPINDCLRKLKDSGLGSLPGGGAEILDDDVREIICRGKESSQEYLEIHGIAHSIGLPTNCTMLFGTVETIEHRLKHLIRIREQQELSGGFQCFVPYPFLPDDSRLPEAQLSSGVEILRMIAISRLFLDNIPHLKAYRMNIGESLTELALQCGADDVDGTVEKESIMHLAGSKADLEHDKVALSKLIIDSGCRPVMRNTTYTKFEVFKLPPIQQKHSLTMAQ
jgi:aminodeoxyfutalosine synthase